MRYDNPVLSVNNWPESITNEVHSDQNFFPFESYLNVYVVKSFGYPAAAYYDFTTETDLENMEIDVTFDGIVIKYNYVGSFDLGDTNLNENTIGRALVHEVGHYFSLLHTFESGCEITTDDNCSEIGDHVCDTPPVANDDDNCQPGIDNTCFENVTYSDFPPNNYLFPATSTDYYDMEANFMGYTYPELCRKSFTQGQVDRMLTSFTDFVFREYISSVPNLINTGIFGPDGCVEGSVLTAVFDVEPTVTCANQPVLFSSYYGTGFSAQVWTWDFGDGTVITELTDGDIEHIYSSTGEFIVTLTVSDGQLSESISEPIFINECQSPIHEQAHWIFGDYVGIDFTPGLPIVDGIAYDDSNDPNDSFTMSVSSATICQSDPETGQLLFYSQGNQLWQPDGTVVATDLGNSNYTLICVPFPNHPDQYFMIIPNQNGDVNYHIISAENIEQVSISQSGIVEVQSGQATSTLAFAVPHCNGQDYWIITNDGNSFLVYLLTEYGLSNATTTNNLWEGSLQPDSYPMSGTIEPTYIEVFGSTVVAITYSGNEKIIERYNFDNQSGGISFVQEYPPFTFNNISSSSARLTDNKRFLYFYGKQTSFGLRSVWRYDLEIGLLQEIEGTESNSTKAALQRGPEQDQERKMYFIVDFDSVNPILHQSLSVIHNPEALDPSETQVQMSAVPYSGFPLMFNDYGFPDFIDGETIPHFNVSSSVTLPSCPDANDASILLDIDINCTSFIVSWSGPNGFESNEEDLLSIAPGTYLLELTAPECNCITYTSEFIVPFVLWENNSPVIVNVNNQNDYASLWTGQNNTFSDDIVFTNGTNITIGNIETPTFFLFSTNSDIVVEEGASVVFINCFFEACGTKWQGFDVKANSSSSTPSGYLRLHECTLSHAEKAIETTDSGLFISLTNQHGGDILCSNTLFINNRKSFYAIRATRKQGMNLPSISFRECHFEVNDGLSAHFPDLSPPYNQFNSHIHFRSSVYGYGFEGCKFINSMTTDITKWSYRGKAILSSKSVYDVRSYQVNINGPVVRNYFSGFDVAIDASRASKRAVRVRFSDFEQNRVGIRLINMPFFQVYENTFSIGELINVEALNNQNPNTQSEVVVGYENGVEEYAPIWYEGVFVNGCHSFVLAENTFDGVWENEGGVDNEFTRIGVRVRDTKTKDDEIRLNTFQDLTVANLANGDNADAANNSGLRYICNTHIDNLFDIQVDDYAGASDVAIDPVQNDLTNDDDEVLLAADNNFTEDADILEEAGRLWNDGLDIVYHYHGSEHDPAPETLNVSPIDLIGVGPNGCLEEWQTGSEHSVAHINSLLVRSSIAQIDVEANEILFLSILDQGSTSDLKQQIENAYGEEILENRDYLLSISPHVSQTVLRSVADRTDKYPHAIALEIFLANPDVLRDNRFISFLATKSDPMPQYMIDLLRAASNQTTQRTIIMNEWNRVQTIYMKNMNRALWSMSYLDDYDDSAIEEVVSAMKILENEFEKIDQLFDIGDISGAENHFDQVLLNYYLPEDLTHEADLFTDWMFLRSTLINSNRSWTDVTSSELNTLYNMVDQYRSWTGRAAMQVLNEYHNEIFQLPPAFSQQWNPRLLLLSRDVPFFVDVYPNPADYFVNFEVENTFSIDKRLTLTIYDILGRPVVQTDVMSETRRFIFDTRQWSSGLYVYEIDVPSFGKINGKFDVQH